MITTYNTLGFLHSYNDQPSLVDDMGNKFWHINGKLERPGDLPCIESINGFRKYSLENGEYKIIRQKSKIIYEGFFNLNQKLHRLDGPAYTSYYKNSNIQSEYYYVDGKLNKLDGPAYISYYENGNIKYEEYYDNGKLSRLNGPAQKIYNFDYILEITRYFIDGKLSRLDGPATINHIKNIKNYYINGKELPKKKFLELTNNLQSNQIL